MGERIELEDLQLAYEDLRPRLARGLHRGLRPRPGGSAYSWWGQLAACEERGHRAVAYDQRGAGRSSKPPGPYSIELWARDLERLLDGLEVERATLVGHSVGCMIAEHAAVRLGERVRGLALIGGALRWRPEAGPVFEERVRLARAGRMDEIARAVAETGLSERCRRENPALHGLFCELIASNDPQAYAEWSAATAVGEMVEPERVDCPTLALCGELDPVTPPGFSEALTAAIPSARAAVVEGAAHWCQLEASAAVSALLLEFLDEIAT